MLTFGLAQALLADGDHAGARRLLEELRAEHKAYRRNEASLLFARALELGGDSLAALDEYENLAATGSGLEVKVRHGRLLRSLGHTTQARAVFREVVDHAERFKLAHEEELSWVKAARQELEQS